MHDINKFGLSDVVECSAALRRVTERVSSMEEAAARISGYLYEEMRGEGGDRAFALVRFFKTHRFDALEAEQKKFALAMIKGLEPPPGMKCLTLLATRGDEPDWNMRTKSRGHMAIPLPSEKMVENAPMISQLITQLGLEIGTVVSPDRDAILDLAQKTYNVFYVPEAKGSPYIVAQRDFVIPYGIRSVLGFGGMLPSGNLFAVIMFGKVAFGRETADMFANVALAAKLGILQFDGRATFAGSAA